MQIGDKMSDTNNTNSKGRFGKYGGQYACLYIFESKEINNMAQTKAHKKKRRSQAPIALVYFITMIIFLFVIGMLALYALREFGVIGNDDSDSDAGIKSPVYNTLFARVNSKGVLADATVIRVAPDAKKIIIMPVSAFTVSGSQTMREIHEELSLIHI